MNTSSLFKPFQYKNLQLKNRIVMAPMTRAQSDNGVPTQNIADYYGRRAASEVGLILSKELLSTDQVQKICRISRISMEMKL